MDFVNVFTVALSLSMDAMVVGSTDGVEEPSMPWWKAMLIALAFGIFQTGMPIIGYFVGYGFRDMLSAAIPWIAFALLTLLSLKSLVEFIKSRKEEEGEAMKKVSFGNVIFQALATSIDALCVGFVFLNLAIAEAMLSFSIIGITTFVLSFGMVMLGKLLGSKIGWFRKNAAIISCIVFFAVGLKILLEGIL